MGKNRMQITFKKSDDEALYRMPLKNRSKHMQRPPYVKLIKELQNFGSRFKRHCQPVELHVA